MPGADRQLVALAVALALFACWPHPALWVPLLGYAVAIGLLSALNAQRLALPPATSRIALLSLLAAPGALALFRARGELAANEGLRGLPELLAQRLRLEALPAIAPPLVSADRPQTFYVHAPEHAQVSVRFGARAAELPAVELGAGLYRVRYDPRRDGPPSPAEGALQATIAVGERHAQRTLRAVTPLPHPRWLARSPDGTLAATVSEETDELITISARGIERRIPVGDAPSDCAFLDATHIAVSHRASDALLIVDAAGGTREQSLALGAFQTRLAVSPDGSLLAVGRGGRNPELVLVGWPQARVLARIAFDLAPDWLAFGADAGTLLVSTRADAALRRYRLGPGGWREDGRLRLGRAAVTLARSRDGARVMLATTDYRPDGRGNLANHFVQDQILFVDVGRLRVERVLLTARRSPRQSKPGDVDRGVSPMGISQAEDGSLLIAFAGTDELWRWRPDAPEPEPIDLYDTELHAPCSVVQLHGGALLLSSPSAGALGLLSGSRAQPRVLRLAPDDAYLLKHDPDALERRLGEWGFYEATRSGISCQSCHMHADSDEAAHNLGTHRLLPTLSVRGLLGTGPFLRDGSFASIGELDHVSQTLYRGYLRRAPGRPQTLQAFVSALPRRPVARQDSPQQLAQQRRGVRAFVRAGCPTCHAFPAFTNLGQQLFRNLFPLRGAKRPADDLLDTPSLLSVGASAPYLSDGRARTLQAVLVDHNRSNRHGNTAALSSGERADLIALLESL